MPEWWQRSDNAGRRARALIVGEVAARKDSGGEPRSSAVWQSQHPREHPVRVALRRASLGA